MSKLSYCLIKDARYFWLKVSEKERTCTWKEFQREYIKLNSRDLDIVTDLYATYLNYLFKEDAMGETALFELFEQKFYTLGFCQFQQQLDLVDSLLIRNCDDVSNLSEDINDIDPEIIATFYSVTQTCPDSLGALKCFCRFGKRFTWHIPFGIKIFERNAYDLLLQNNNRCKMLNRGITDSYSARYIISRMKTYVQKVEECFFQQYEEPDPYYMDHVFIPNGSNYEGYKTQSQKLSALVKRSWGVFPHQLVNLSEDSAQYEYLNVKNPTTGWTLRRVNKCRFASVPKSYKGDRGISLMETTNTALLDRPIAILMDCLSRATSGAIQIFDQGQNREFCMNSVIFYDDLATIDLSSASDLISYSLIKELFSPEFLGIVEPYRAHVVEYSHGGKENTTLLHMWSLMGEKDTFPMECIVFWSLYRACCDIYNTFQDSSMSYVDYHSISVYGDDGICDCRLVPIVLHFMESLGMKPNRTKSYYDEQYSPFFPDRNIRFRESCGVDVLTVDNFITVLPQLYLPRGGFKEGNQLVIQLIDMQHRAIEKNAELLSEALVKWISVLVGGEEYLTYSEVGSEYQDIWSFDPPTATYHYTYAPVAEGTIAPQWTFRHLHMAFVDDREVVDNSHLGASCANWYAYQEFLRVGPSYDDELMRLLGCSTRWVSPIQMRSSSKTPKLEYKE